MIVVLKAWFNDDETVDLNSIQVEHFAGKSRKEVTLFCLLEAQKQVIERFDALYPNIKACEYAEKKRKQLVYKLALDIAYVQSLTTEQLAEIAKQENGNYFVYLFDIEYHVKIL